MKISTYTNDSDREFSWNACKTLLFGKSFGGVGGVDYNAGTSPIILPTETVYGLCCLPSDCQSVDKIFEIKRRDKTKPLPMLAANLNFLFDASCKLSNNQLTAIEKFYINGTTFIVRLPSDCQFLQNNKICEGTTKPLEDGSIQIGVRVPQHKFCQELLQSLPSQIMVGTSCNFSGEPPIETLDSIAETKGEIYENVTIGIENNNEENTMSHISSTIINLNEAADNEFGFAIVR